MSDDYNPDDPLEGASQCPHGNHFAAVTGDDVLRAVCKVCGAPRIRIKSDKIELSGDEQAPLRTAGKTRVRRFAWRTAGVFGAVASAFGLAGTLLLTLLFGVGVFATGLPLALTFPFAVVAIAGLGRSRSLSSEIQELVDKAWKSAVRDVALNWGQPVTATEVSKALGMDEDEAERMLSQLAVEDVLRSDVAAEGKLSFAPAFRIGGTDLPSGALSADADLEARFQALEEAGPRIETPKPEALSADADLEARFEALAAQEAAEAEAQVGTKTSDS